MDIKAFENSRRKFLRQAAAAGIVASVGTAAILTSCKQKKKSNYAFPPMLPQAPDGPLLKAGVVGCGYRGTGAAINFLNAGPNVQVTALADIFADKVEDCKQQLKKKKGVDISPDLCFTGIDAYEKLINSGIDVVILATPPHFRPQHFEACIQARKHVFMEKPIAVDPVGVRSVMVSAKKSEALGLSVVTGTIKRHQQDYIETYKRVADGVIGDIVSANSYYNVGKLWHRNPRAEWSELEYMVRDWVNWCWLSGDHIVEQHVHNLDTINWHIGKHPEKAIGFGGRHRRVTGDQYDMFSVDFVYEPNIHYHSMCRQINDCSNKVGDLIVGTHGSTNCENTIYELNGAVKWTFDYPKTGNGSNISRLNTNPFDQEHINLVTAIRTAKPINEAYQIAESTLTGIMGRISAYTGKETTWEEMMNSDLYLGPKTYVMGPVDILKEVPKQGSAPK
ncbi:Tat (twin-arginine translocation) pathway signal sequence [Saccharicrinis carchari]|uniref:Tat (Twin-arginine translocation) pathway signal sequence n=1 Tax=Saccharicrinis carchari TaxID=1168039 RepID=A0A521BYJ8_SACCC|nr:Gfo/Idh/MocA family oxidoreductase [Saccharicrinis carchari]SMO52224.1 Tat (twin-arginine translocation) pathway signal sequence [Saccharicrinis carchari]